MAFSVRSIFERLRDDADILDAGLAHGVYHQRERAEWNGFVAAQVDRIALRITHLRVNLASQLVDVYRIVSDINSLGAVNRNDHSRFGNFLDCLRFGDVHLDSGLQNRRGDHEDHQEDEHDVHERDNVNVRKGGAGLARELRHIRQRLKPASKNFGLAGLKPGPPSSFVFSARTEVLPNRRASRNSLRSLPYLNIGRTHTYIL